MNHDIPTPQFDTELTKALDENLIESATLDWHETDEEGIKWTLDICKWPEGARPLTESGRREIAAEDAAISRLIEAAKRDGFQISDYPAGSGSNDRGSQSVEWVVNPPVSG